MNRNSPDYYIESSSEQSIATTEALIKYIRSLPSPNIEDAASQQPNSDGLVQPVLTPRFALSCTSDLLLSLGKIAASDSTLCIQTHISENLNEVSLTKELFPNSETYAGVYDDHGLLRENTILAHAVHLDEAEMELVKKKKAGVSHCPTSNFNLSSGVAKVGEFLDRGIKVKSFGLLNKFLNTNYVLNMRRLVWAPMFQAVSPPRSSRPSSMRASPLK